MTRLRKQPGKGKEPKVTKNPIAQDADEYQERRTGATSSSFGTAVVTTPPLPSGGRPKIRMTRAQQKRQVSDDEESDTSSSSGEAAVAGEASTTDGSGGSSSTSNNSGSAEGDGREEGELASGSGDSYGEYGTPIRSRQRFTHEETCILEEVYQRAARPSTETKQRLAVDFDTTTQRIQIWFQNRRAKEKKMSAVVQQGGMDDQVTGGMTREEGESSTSGRGRPLAEINERRKHEARLRRILAAEEEGKKKKRRLTEHRSHDDNESDNNDEDQPPVQFSSPAQVYLGDRLITHMGGGGRAFYQRRASADDTTAGYNPILDYYPPTGPAVHYTRVTRHSDPNLPPYYSQKPLYTMANSPTINPAEVINFSPAAGAYPPFRPTDEVGYLSPAAIALGVPSTMRTSMYKRELPEGGEEETAYLNVLAEVSTSHQPLVLPTQQQERRSSRASSSGFGELCSSGSNILAHGENNNGFNPPSSIEEQREEEEEAAAAAEQE